MESSVSWTPCQNEMLIKLVKENPDLYDRGRAGHSNSSSVEDIWKRIASNFRGKTATDCKKKWQMFRNQYRQHCKEQMDSLDGIAKKEIKWAYFESLMFMNPYLSNLPASFKDNVKETPHNLSSEIVSKPQFQQFPVKNNEQTPTQAAKSSDINEIKQNALKGNGNSVSKKGENIRNVNRKHKLSAPLIKHKKQKIGAKKVKKMSPVDSFFSSIKNDMEKLPEPAFRELKIEVLNLVHKKLREHGL